MDDLAKEFFRTRYGRVRLEQPVVKHKPYSNVKREGFRLESLWREVGRNFDSLRKEKVSA